MQEEIVYLFNGMYKISSLGFFISCRRRSERKMAIRVKKRGPYPVVQININGKRLVRQMHILMAQSFIPNPENKPQVNHKNGIKTDYTLSNLEWVTVSENAIHAFKTGLRKPQIGEDQAHSKLKNAEVLEIFNSTLPQKELAEVYKISHISINDIKTGRCWSHITGKSFSGKFYQLPEKDVLDIFHSDLKQIELANKYRLHPTTISDIKTGRHGSKITGKTYIRKNKRRLLL